MTGAADFSANEMYEQCLPVSGENFSPNVKARRLAESFYQQIALTVPSLLKRQKKNALIAGAGNTKNLNPLPVARRSNGDC